MGNYAKPRGTRDFLQLDSGKLQILEMILKEVVSKAGYKQIITPIFEHTEVFTRSAGESSDIVNKEMYTFLDKGNRSISLRPEGTAGVIRAFVENKMHYKLAIEPKYKTSPVQVSHVQIGESSLCNVDYSNLYCVFMVYIHKHEVVNGWHFYIDFTYDAQLQEDVSINIRKINYDEEMTYNDLFMCDSDGDEDGDDGSGSGSGSGNGSGNPVSRGDAPPAPESTENVQQENATPSIPKAPKSRRTRTGKK